MNEAEAITVYSDDESSEAATSQPSHSPSTAAEVRHSPVAHERKSAPRSTVSAPAAASPHRSSSSASCTTVDEVMSGSQTRVITFTLTRTQTQADVSPRHDSKSSRAKQARMRASASTLPPPGTSRSSTSRMRVRPTTVLQRSFQQMMSRYLPAQWPNNILNLRSNFNPDGIVMPFTPLFGKCLCKTPCRQETCRNAILGVFCAPNCCPFYGRCGNGLSLSEDVMLATDSTTQELAVVATQHIDEGIILGEYLGRLTLEKPRQQRTLQRGYRLVMHEAPKDCGRWKACIDADGLGSLMRFVNHSCTPDCQFSELGNGLEHTVVVSTIRAIEAGEEVTVDYAAELWFICRCGSQSCKHRHIQHLRDP